MKHFIVFFVCLFVAAGCVPVASNTVDAAEKVVGYYQYQPLLEQLTAARVAACEGVEGCVPEPISEQDILRVVTEVRNRMETEGARVIGVEPAGARIWFEK